MTPTPGRAVPITPRMHEAIAELKALMLSRYLETTFRIAEGDAPSGSYLMATVDVDDLGDVIDLFGDRLVDLQVDKGLPLYVLPLRAPERGAAILAERRARAGAAPAPR